MSLTPSGKIFNGPLNISQERTEESAIHRSVLERSLRRRLWKAIQEEDAITAMSVYTATKVDYETWLEKELCEEYRMKMIEAVKSDVIDVVSRCSLIIFIQRCC
jgi:hypothetical protein